MQLTIGRTVQYTLNETDAQVIAQQRMSAPVGTFSVARAGDTYPAVIVRKFGDQPDSAVNLQVLLDGRDSYWATSRQQGDGEGRWVWPTVPAVAAAPLEPDPEKRANGCS